ncbi:hypothetical protein DNTS_008972 [Danionella cerebrum]|uniref:BTB domain-containing protein n=1 Tax=Danionella cerebrum TaxID=2873325 RepID=A0A553Q4D5_9TELE|nr:hypothetical protein DNTS_008972 [Danionella translucida]
MSPGEDGLIGIPFPEHSSELLSRLNAQRHSGLLCDLTLTSRGTSYQTHRAVMAAVSRYFRRVFGGHEGPRVLQLDCVEPEALASLLEFAYTATLTVRSSGMRELLSAATLLGIECVAEACREILGETGPNQLESDVGEVEDELNKFGDEEEEKEVCFEESERTLTGSACQSPEEIYEGIQRIQDVNTPSSGGFLSNGNSKWMLDSISINKSKDTSLKGGESVPHEQIGQSLQVAVPSGGSGRKRKSQMPQQCPVCQKIIHGAGKLPRHMRTHTGEKPFQCTACGVRFTRNDKLKIHMRRHTGERPYHCTMCSARFLHSYDLKNHLSLHSGARPFECPLCHKAFAREDHLTRHRKGHGCLELRSRRTRRGMEPGHGEGFEVVFEHEPGTKIEDLSPRSRPGPECREGAEFETRGKIEAGVKLESVHETGATLKHRTNLGAEKYQRIRLQPGARAGLQRELETGAQLEYETRFEPNIELEGGCRVRVGHECNDGLEPAENFKDRLVHEIGLKARDAYKFEAGVKPRGDNGINFEAGLGARSACKPAARFVFSSGTGLELQDEPKVRLQTQTGPKARLGSGPILRETPKDGLRFEPRLGGMSELSVLLPAAQTQCPEMLYRAMKEPMAKKQDGEEGSSQMGNGSVMMCTSKQREEAVEEDV